MRFFVHDENPLGFAVHDSITGEIIAYHPKEASAEYHASVLNFGAVVPGEDCK